MIRSSLESKLYILSRLFSTERGRALSVPVHLAPGTHKSFPPFPNHNPDRHRQFARSCTPSLPDKWCNFPLGSVFHHARPSGLALAYHLYLLDFAGQCRPRAALAGDAAAFRTFHRPVAFDLRHRHWHDRRGPAGARGRSGSALFDCRPDGFAFLVASGGLAAGTYTRPSRGTTALRLCSHTYTAV